MAGRGRGRVWVIRAVGVSAALVALSFALGPGPQAPSVDVRTVSLTDPTPPSAVVATGADRALEVSWTASTEALISGYQVLVDGSVAVTTSGTGTSATVPALVNGHSYVVTVRTQTSLAGTTYTGSTASSPVTGIPRDAVAPAAPTGVTAVRGEHQVQVAWSAGPEYDVDAYRVLRDGVVVSGVLTGLSFTDTGLVNDQTYLYSVEARDTSGNWSPPSSPAVPATPTDLTAPAAPTGLVAVRGDGRVDLSWTANGEPDLATYRVLRDGAEVAVVASGAVTSYADTGLTNDQTYPYRLVAVDTHGNRSVTSAAVPATPTDLTAPAAPAGLVAVRGDGRVDLSWTANGEPDVATYRVLRDGVEVGTVTGTAYADTGLTNDQTYSYRLAAVDTHGNRSADSAALTATPTDLTPPAPPTGPTATAGERQVSLAWTASVSGDVVSYRVSRDGTVVATVAGTSTVVTGLAPGTAATFTVVAVDGHGNVSAASAPASATPYDTTAPAAPTGVTGRPGSMQATISWTAPADVDPLTYRVYRDGALAATVSSSSTTITGLANGTSYAFTVVAVDPSGNASAASAAVSVTPVAGTVPVQGSGETGGLAASSDGRFVVVGTRARLEPADTNTAYELYLLDRTAGTAARIAPVAAGATAADSTNSAAPAVSDDGRYVALATTAALVPADTNRLLDVYRFHIVNRTWSLVSVPASGAVSSTVAGTALQGGSSVFATSPSVVISADGDLVLFYSARADLVAGDANGVIDVFAKRMSTGAVTRVSTSAAGTDLPRAATGPALALTPDGRFALFPATSSAGPVVLYRKTLSGAGAGEATVVSTVVVGGRSTEVAAFRDTGDVDISDDGRYVAFVTAAKPTAPATSWSTGLAYRKDTATGALAALGNGQTTAWEHQVALDPSGRYGFFSTTAAVTAGDTNGHTDVLRRDLGIGTLTLVTADAGGAVVSGPVGAVAPAEYGRVLAVSGDVVVLTTSQALLPADANRLRDVYVKELGTGTVLSPAG